MSTFASGKTSPALTFVSKAGFLNSYSLGRYIGLLLYYYDACVNTGGSGNAG